MNGGDLSTRRLVVDNGFLTEREWGYMDDDELHWVCHTQNAADKSAWPKSAVEAAETRELSRVHDQDLQPLLSTAVWAGRM